MKKADREATKEILNSISQSEITPTEEVAQETSVVTEDPASDPEDRRGKAGRHKGTDKQWIEDNKTIKNQNSTQKWANKLMPKVLPLLEKKLLDPKTSPVVVKGISELIMKITKEYYDKIEIAPDGRAVNKVKKLKSLKEEVADEARKQREEIEKKGIKGNGLISLQYIPESGEEENTGT